MTLSIIYLIAGIIAGFLFGITLQRGKTKLESNRADSESRRADNESRRAETEATRANEESTRANYEATRAAAEFNRASLLEQSLKEREQSYAKLSIQQEEHHRDALSAMEGRFDETIAKMREQIQNLTGQLLKERQSEFESSSRDSIGRITAPLMESIKQMQEAVDKNTLRHSELGGTLSANISTLLEQSEAARRSADRLTDALRNNGRVQGEWGETILTELLESNGLKRGIHFDVQESLRDDSGNTIRNEEGKSMRPDVILHLDRERDVVIDSKVSLSSFLDYVNASDEADRKRYLAEHLASLRKHVKELADKDYSWYTSGSKQRMGYVIMFVPSTAALYAATNESPDLWRKAMEQNVYIADEQTLYAALKIVSLTWRQIAQADNHRQVYDLANEMLKRVGMFMEKYLTIGKSLENARKAFDDGMAKLDSGGQSIPGTCNKLIKLGAKPQPRKNVPDRLLGIDDSESTQEENDLIS